MKTRSCVSSLVGAALLLGGAVTVGAAERAASADAQKAQVTILYDAIDTPEGIVLVVGCSHPTIEKIVEAARTTLNEPIHLIVGGTHLLPAKDDEIARIAMSLKDNAKVAWIAPVHCTGEPVFEILKKTFGDRDLYAGVGSTLTLGPTVRSLSAEGEPQMHAMDEDDRLSITAACSPTAMTIRHAWWRTTTRTEGSRAPTLIRVR